MGSKHSSPPPPPTPSPTTVVKIGVVFFNAIQDSNQYFLIITNVVGNRLQTAQQPFGSSVQLFKSTIDPAKWPYADSSSYSVVRATDNTVVAKGFPIPVDNQNQLVIVAWNDAQNNYYSTVLGSYGPNSNRACIYGKGITCLHK